MGAVTSRTLALGADLTLVPSTREVPDPAPGQARVRLERAGICGSDLHVLRTGDWVAYWPAVLGHEGVGVVESCPGGELAVGTRVVLDSRVGCGACEGCERSPVLCRSLQWVGEAVPGAFQEYATFPVGSLVACPDGVDPDVAVLAEPLAVAVHATGLPRAVPDRVLLLGFGPIGALVHTELTRRNPAAEVTVAEVHPERAALARAAGARVAEAPAGSWPLVVDAAGFPGSLSLATDRAGIGGEVVLVGIGHVAEPVVPQTLVEKSLTVHGSHGFTDELPDAVALLAQAPDRYRWLVTDTFSLDEAAAALPALTLRAPVGKAVVRL